MAPGFPVRNAQRFGVQSMEAADENHSRGSKTMLSITMKQLLEAGVHFGHQSRRWNPKMKKYIYTERNHIYIIDLKKTIKMVRDAYKFVRDAVAEGSTVLFVGTKKQAKDSILNAAMDCNMHYVNNRWLGGMLTNFRTVRQSVKRLIEIDKMIEDGAIEQFKKKEQSMLMRERNSLDKNLAGVKNMDRLPDIAFIIDPHKEEIAVLECKRLRIPIVALVDTNCNPDPIDWIIPGNDDAIRAIKLISQTIADAVTEGLLARVEDGAGMLGAKTGLAGAVETEATPADLIEEKYAAFRPAEEQAEETADYGAAEPEPEADEAVVAGDPGRDIPEAAPLPTEDDSAMAPPLMGEAGAEAPRQEA
jgi:small subunit ribosomal protein S2